MTNGRRAGAVAAAALVTSLLAACGGGSPSGSGATLTVLAASSLTEALPVIASAFEAEHDQAEVRLSFGGSQELVAQASGGAPADVLALAGTSSLDAVSDVVGRPVVFAHNELTIIVPPGNPARVTGLADLANPRVAVALAGPEVPAGQYAAEALDAAGVTVSPVSEEVDVKAVVTRVTVGGADAGIVYVTDATAAGDAVETVAIPRQQNVVAAYPAVTLDAARQPGLARAFVAFLRSPQAQQVLRQFGFAAA
jgi:molybdate transport system substrate-binding protein